MQIAQRLYQGIDIEGDTVGLIGLESCFGIVNKVLCKDSKMELIDLISYLTNHPREIMGFDCDLFSVGSSAEIVVIDPEQTIVESSDDNNYLDIQDDLQSENPVMDVALVVISKWSVPTIIMGATAALIGVAGLMMISRRKEATRVVGDSQR